MEIKIKVIKLEKLPFSHSEICTWSMEGDKIFIFFVLTRPPYGYGVFLKIFNEFFCKFLNIFQYFMSFKTSLSPSSLSSQVLWHSTPHLMPPTLSPNFSFLFALLETDWDYFEIHEASQVPTVPFTIQQRQPPTNTFFSTIFSSPLYALVYTYIRWHSLMLPWYLLNLKRLRFFFFFFTLVFWAFQFEFYEDFINVVVGML